MIELLLILAILWLPTVVGFYTDPPRMPFRFWQTLSPSCGPVKIGAAGFNYPIRSRMMEESDRRAQLQSRWG
jgi:hypothetical protein